MFPPLIRAFLLKHVLFRRFDSCWEIPCELYLEAIAGLVLRDQLVSCHVLL